MKAKNKILVAFMLLSLVFLLLTGCRGETQDPIEDAPPPQQEELEEETSEEVEETSKEATVEALLEEKNNKIAILSFWVSWNEDSKQQLDILENVYMLLEEEVTFIGIHATSVDTVSQEEIIDYIEEKQYSFSILLDEDSKYTEDYFVGQLPTIVFLNEEEKVVNSYTILMEEDTILDEIEFMLEKLLQ